MSKFRCRSCGKKQRGFHFGCVLSHTNTVIWQFSSFSGRGRPQSSNGTESQDQPPWNTLPGYAVNILNLVLKPNKITFVTNKKCWDNLEDHKIYIFHMSRKPAKIIKTVSHELPKNKGECFVFYFHWKG